MEHLALFPARFAKENAADKLSGFPGSGELVVERSQHSGDLLQAVPVLTAGSQPCEELDVLEVVETVEDGAQQQFRQVELDSFPEPLARRLQLVSYFRLGEKRVKFGPGTKQNIKFSLPSLLCNKNKLYLDSGFNTSRAYFSYTSNSSASASSSKHDPMAVTCKHLGVKLHLQLTANTVLYLAILGHL